jgi:Flp pilus assembly protein TadG
MVEFVIVVPIFLALTLGVIDAARAVFVAHNLSRSAETLATDLKLQFELNAESNMSPASLTSPIYASDYGTKTPLSDAVTVGSGSFTPTWNANSYAVQNGSSSSFQYMSNSSDHPLSRSPSTPSIYVCGVPDFNSANSTTTPPDPGLSYIQVTLTSQFTPITSFLLGGRTITISESASVQTTEGDASTNTSSQAGASVCSPLS